MRKNNTTTIVDQLKNAVQTSGITSYALAKQAGIGRAALGRFIHGERGLTLDSAAALCHVLGLELSPTKKGR